MTVTQILEQRIAALRENRHVQEEVQRLMEPLRVIKGTQSCPTYEAVLNNVATIIVAMQENPELTTSANNSGIIVHRGPIEGYTISLWAASVYSLQVGLDFWHQAVGTQ